MWGVNGAPQKAEQVTVPTRFSLPSGRSHRHLEEDGGNMVDLDCKTSPIAQGVEQTGEGVLHGIYKVRMDLDG